MVLCGMLCHKAISASLLTLCLLGLSLPCPASAGIQATESLPLDHARAVKVVASDQEAPSKTVPFDKTLLSGTPDIPLTTLLQSQPAAASNSPWQVRVGYQGPGRYLVSWNSGQFMQSTKMMSTATSNDSSNAMMAPMSVRYGTAKDKLDLSVMSMMVTYSLNLDILPTKPLSYESPDICHALLTGLSFGTTYYYAIGNDTTVYSFTTLPASLPLRIGVMGDIGQTANTSDTLRHLVANKPQLVLNMGDFCYADNYMYDPVNITQHGQRWDSWGSLTQELLSGVPALHTNGNHEIEPHLWEPQAPRQVAYNARYPVPVCDTCDLQLQPNQGPGSANNMYYSVNVPGAAHIVALTSYIQNDTLDSRSAQYKWLETDLKAVNRTATPWLIVFMHSPWYNSYASHFKENDCMRQGFEELLYNYGVDIIFLGHVHAYERSKPVYNNTVDSCGPVHITIGDGGNKEGLYRDFVDTKPPNFCTNTTARKLPAYQPRIPDRPGCFPFLDNGTQFCYTEQPAWSAMRDPSFGHGILTIQDDTTAKWEWHRNQDAQDVVADSVILTRNMNCPSANMSTANPTSMVPSVQGVNGTANPTSMVPSVQGVNGTANQTAPPKGGSSSTAMRLGGGLVPAVLLAAFAALAFGV